MQKAPFELMSVPQHQRGHIGSFTMRALPKSKDFGSWWANLMGNQQRAELASRFKQLHTDKLWLACTCTARPLDPPLLCFVEKAGSYSLRRLTERAAHAESCVFWSEQEESDPSINRVQEGMEKPVAQPEFLEAEKEESIGRKSVARLFQSKEPSSERMDSCARQLFWLLEKSGINRYPRTVNPTGLILSLAATITLKGDLKLSDVIFCKPEFWHSGWMGKAFDRSSDAGLGRQAVLISVVSNASRAEGWVRMCGYGDKTPVSGKLAIFGSDDTASRYPMLMYAKVQHTPGNDPVISRAYLHPIRSEDDWCPVDSGNERTALEVILDCCRELDEVGVSVVLEKPVFNWRDSGVRPDFVLSRNLDKKVLVIETMGFDDDDYRSRKAQLTKALAQYTVLEDNRVRPTAQTDIALSRQILEFFNKTLRIQSHLSVANKA